MVRTSQQDRLLPSLLDRLTDNEPEKNEESLDFKVLSIQSLKEKVLRDLAWLLNTTANTDLDDEETPIHIQESVLNYGIPALTGSYLSGVSMSDLKQKIKNSIITFEPRILADSIELTNIDADLSAAHNLIAFKIKAQLWAQPAPIELLINSAVDLETGQFSVEEF